MVGNFLKQGEILPANRTTSSRWTPPSASRSGECRPPWPGRRVEGAPASPPSAKARTRRTGWWPTETAAAAPPRSASIPPRGCYCWSSGSRPCPGQEAEERNVWLLLQQTIHFISNFPELFVLSDNLKISNSPSAWPRSNACETLQTGASAAPRYESPCKHTTGRQLDMFHLFLYYSKYVFSS